MKTPCQHLCLIVFATVFIAVTSTSLSFADTPPQTAGNGDWKIGYWVWEASYLPLDPDPSDSKPIDLIYAQAGEYQSPIKDGSPNHLYLRLSDRLPAAERYIAVLRFSEPKVPDNRIIEPLLKEYLAMKENAQHRGRKLAGLQFDLDCPTGHLHEYARFLRGVRSAFPREEIISITAILDWFRPGTGVADVIASVDEFVPQFYDVSSRQLSEEQVGVAQEIDPARWGRVFNSFGKPYRIGISSFGRIVGISKGKKGPPCSDILSYSPLEIFAGNRFKLAAKGSSKAGETLLRFRNRGSGEADGSCPSHQEIRMIIPTRASVSTAYNAAKKMGEWCRGVIFFRWALSNEAMTLSWPQVEAAISGSAAVSPGPGLESEDGLCATVSCTDLYLRLNERFPEKPLSLRIQSSRKLEYFLPEPLLKSKPDGEQTILVTIPAYAGVPRIFLGRAITLEPADFRLEEHGR
jgi:hypothetical protein